MDADIKQTCTEWQKPLAASLFAQAIEKKNHINMYKILSIQEIICHL